MNTDKLNPNLIRRFEVFSIRKTKAGTIEIRAGVAHAERDGTINVVLDVLPIDGQLMLRLPAEVQPSTKPPMRIPVAPAVDTLNMKPAPDQRPSGRLPTPNQIMTDEQPGDVEGARAFFGGAKCAPHGIGDCAVCWRYMLRPQHQPTRTGASGYQPPEAPGHCMKDPKCWRAHDHEGDCYTDLPF